MIQLELDFAMLSVESEDGATRFGGQGVFDRGQRHCNPKWTVRCF